jgi:hypothetical protein
MELKVKGILTMRKGNGFSRRSIDFDPHNPGAWFKFIVNLALILLVLGLLLLVMWKFVLIFGGILGIFWGFIKLAAWQQDREERKESEKKINLQLEAERKRKAEQAKMNANWK